MKGIPPALFLFVLGCLLFVQVEGRISVNNVVARTPQGKGGPEGPGKSPGPGKNPRASKPKPKDDPLSISTSSVQSTETNSPSPSPEPSSLTTPEAPSSATSEAPSSTTSQDPSPTTPPSPPSETPPPLSTVPRPTLLPITFPRLTFPTTAMAMESTSPLAPSAPSVPSATSVPSAPSRTAIVPLPSSPLPDGVIKESPPTENASYSHRTLVIVLSVVLGSVGILLVALVLFLISRCRKRRAFRRGVSPINDQEIESWRNTEIKQPLSLASPRGPPGANSAPGALTSPGWDWFSFEEVRSPAPTHTRGTSLVAQAPNARVGLTTDTVPGAEPFIPPVKRQSSRLSKAPRGSHLRTKSMRSSTSAKSVRSIHVGDVGVGVLDFTRNEDGAPNWFAPDDRRTSSHVFSTAETSSPGTSIYDGFNGIGGLSPTPAAPIHHAFTQKGGSPSTPTAPIYQSFTNQDGLSPAPKSRQVEPPTQTTSDKPPVWPILWN